MRSVRPYVRFKQYLKQRIQRGQGHTASPASICGEGNMGLTQRLIRLIMRSVRPYVRFKQYLKQRIQQALRAPPGGARSSLRHPPPN